MNQYKRCIGRWNSVNTRTAETETTRGGTLRGSDPASFLELARVNTKQYQHVCYRNIQKTQTRMQSWDTCTRRE